MMTIDVKYPKVQIQWSNDVNKWYIRLDGKPVTEAVAEVAQGKGVHRRALYFETPEAAQEYLKNKGLLRLKPGSFGQF
jgi:hypothetical protein